MTEAIDEWDELSRGIVRALAEEFDGVATTSDLKEYFGVDRDKINYRRREYLEPEDVVESESLPSDPGQIAPKRLVLTEWGHEVAAAISEDVLDQRSLERRVSDIEQDIADLQASLDEVVAFVRDESEGIEEQLSEYQQTIEDLEERVAALEASDEPRRRRRRRSRQTE